MRPARTSVRYQIGPHEQAAAADGPNSDDDGVSDPEMPGQDLFDLVSFSMMLAAAPV